MLYFMYTIVYKKCLLTQVCNKNILKNSVTKSCKKTFTKQRKKGALLFPALDLVCLSVLLFFLPFIFQILELSKEYFQAKNGRVIFGLLWDY